MILFCNELKLVNINQGEGNSQFLVFHLVILYIKVVSCEAYNRGTVTVVYMREHAWGQTPQSGHAVLKTSAQIRATG